MGKNLYLFSKKLRNVTKIVYPLITLYELIKTFAVNNLTEHKLSNTENSTIRKTISYK